MKAVGDEYYVQANIDTGPFSLGAVLLGAEKFLLDIMTEDEGLIEAFLDFCTEVVIAYGKAMIETGVHGIQFGDATASLMGPEHFEKFALPWEKKAVDELTGKECDIWIHICGKTDQFLHMLKELDFHGFEVDAKVPMTTARELLGERLPSRETSIHLFAPRTPEAVYNATQEMIRSGDFKQGWWFLRAAVCPG